MAAVPFAISPAPANTGLLDYTTVEHAKLFAKASAPLTKDGYDLGADGHKTFLADLDDRAVAFGWDGNLSIPEDIAAPAVNLHLLTREYGRITLEQVRAHTNTYLGTDTRDEQNSFQMFECLMASLTTTAKAKVNLVRSKFMVDGRGCGPLLLKVIIGLAYVDTRSTVLHIRSNLNDLDAHMVSVNSNIELFNAFVLTNWQGLTARGETTLDLLANLFDGYLAAQDKDFVEFIKRKKDAYEEGEENLEPEQLMEKAELKYNSLIQAGTWKQKTEQEEQIIALQTQLTHMKQQRTKGANKQSKDKSSKAKKSKDHATKRPDWVNIPPPEGDDDTKEVDGVTYYWCGKHGFWTLNAKHTTAQCKGINVPKTPSGNKKTKDAAANDKKVLKVSKALASILDDDHKEDEEEANDDDCSSQSE